MRSSDIWRELRAELLLFCVWKEPAEAVGASGSILDTFLWRFSGHANLLESVAGVKDVWRWIRNGWMDGCSESSPEPAENNHGCSQRHKRRAVADCVEGFDWCVVWILMEKDREWVCVLDIQYMPYGIKRSTKPYKFGSVVIEETDFRIVRKRLWPSIFSTVTTDLPHFCK